MKKLILTISIFFTLISLAEARECKSGDIKGDAFIYSDGKKVTVIKGTDIPNPENNCSNSLIFPSLCVAKISFLFFNFPFTPKIKAIFN